MALVVRAFPVKNRDEVESFANELRHRERETHGFYTSFNVNRETWFFQEGPYGAMVIGVTDVADPLEPIAEAYRQTDEPFAAWFKQRVLEMTGVDPNETPLGPETELMYEFHAR